MTKKEIKKESIQEKNVKTNMGEIPLEDYLEIQARKYGFNSYKELKDAGLYIDI